MWTHTLLPLCNTGDATHGPAAGRSQSSITLAQRNHNNVTPTELDMSRRDRARLCGPGSGIPVIVMQSFSSSGGSSQVCSRRAGIVPAHLFAGEPVERVERVQCRRMAILVHCAATCLSASAWRRLLGIHCWGHVESHELPSPRQKDRLWILGRAASPPRKFVERCRDARVRRIERSGSLFAVVVIHLLSR